VDELLCEQIAEPAGGLDRPRPFPERLRPREQLRCLLARCTDPRAVELALAVVDRDRGVTRLVWIDTDDHRHEHLPGLQWMRNREGTPAWDRLCTFLFRATPRRGPRRAALRSKANRQQASGRHFVSNPARTSRRNESTATS